MEVGLGEGKLSSSHEWTDFKNKQTPRYRHTFYDGSAELVWTGAMLETVDERA